MKARNLFVIAVLLVAVLSTSGLAASFDPETFVFAGSGQPPQTLDPAAIYDTASGEVAHQVYDNLFEYVGGIWTLWAPPASHRSPPHRG